VVRDKFEFADEDDDESKDSQKSKKRRNTLTCVKWSPKELAEIQEYFNDILTTTTKTTPGRRECDTEFNTETVIHQSKVFNILNRVLNSVIHI
jgi:hypothetical protein